MERMQIPYEENKNCFEETKTIPSELIWGDLNDIKNPWFSYIIPVYKRADLLEETLKSVLAQKEVSFSWDIVVVDNEAGGENETEALVRKINSRRILYYRNLENLGPDGNYNRCIELARGKWLGMLHADDLIMDDHLRLMGRYIQSKKYGFSPLAYISPRYQEFMNRDAISLKRPARAKAVLAFKDRINIDKKYNGRLKRFRQIDALITGYSVGLPSFGTVMNKRVMLESGGFNKALGICEDVLIPYKLAKHYRVYKTPYIMGYYRFERNESMKTQTIFKICESMYDFREYMFHHNMLTKLWGTVARDHLFQGLTDYGAYLSRFGDYRLKKKDFEYIHQPKTGMAKKINLALFNFTMRFYSIFSGEITYEQGLEQVIKDLMPEIWNCIKSNKSIIVYGAGNAGRCVGRILYRKYRVKILCYAVTEEKENQKKIGKIPVMPIEKLKQYADNSLVIIATTTPDYYDEMELMLVQHGFQNKIELCRNFSEGNR